DFSRTLIRVEYNCGLSVTHDNLCVSPKRLCCSMEQVYTLNIPRASPAACNFRLRSGPAIDLTGTCMRVAVGVVSDGSVKSQGWPKTNRWAHELVPVCSVFR